MDYDPLAWLEEDQPVQHNDIGAETVSGKQLKKSASDTRSGKQNPATKRAGKLSSKAGVATGSTENVSPNDEQEAASPEQQPPVATDGEEPAYGFFESDEDSNETADNGSKDSEEIIDLGSELGIQAVAGCQQQIEALLARDLEIRFEAGSLQKVDTAGIQLLFSLQQNLGKTGRSIHWHTPSALIDEAAAQLGMPSLIGGNAGDQQACGFFAESPGGAEPDSVTDQGFGFF